MGSLSGDIRLGKWAIVCGECKLMLMVVNLKEDELLSRAELPEGAEGACHLSLFAVLDHAFYFSQTQQSICSPPKVGCFLLVLIPVKKWYYFDWNFFYDTNIALVW
jgi:hypothetical protein